MPKVSVIIPVYCAAATIVRCVESLLSQTLADLEVILVDDHGGDESLELVEALLTNHHRKTMFHFAATPRNSGPGEARNVGIQLAKGEYVAFLDSDDWVESTMYEELYCAATAYNADVVCCDALLEGSNRNSRELCNPQLPAGTLTPESRAFFLTHYVAYLWTFIYRRSFLVEHGIVFPPERSAEDSYFIACCVLLATSFAHVEKSLYHYIVHPNSLSQIRNATRYQQKLAVFNRLIEFAKANQLYESYQSELDFIYLKKAYVMGVFNYCMNTIKPDKTVVMELSQQMRSLIPNYKSNKYYLGDFKTRLVVSFLVALPRLTTWILPRLIRHTNVIV